MLKLLISLRNKKGFTIVEILIACFIVLAISTFSLQAFLGQKDAQRIQAQVSDTQQAATFCMAEMTKTIRNAGYRVPGGADCRIAAGALGYDTLVIYCFNDDSLRVDSTCFFLDHTGDSTNYKLCRKVNGEPAEIFAEYIEDVDFTQPNSKTLTVTIQARTEDIDPHLNSYRIRTISSNVLMRNAS